MRPFSMFEPLVGTARRWVDDQLFAKRQAERSLRQTVEGYRELLHDPRYLKIRRDAESILSSQLERLVDEAARCPRCVVYAERVRLLKDVVLLPGELVAYARSQDQAERESSERMESEEVDVLAR